MRSHKGKYPTVTYNDVTEAFLSLIESINNHGKIIDGKNGRTKELNSISFSIKNPIARAYIIPGRRNNIYSTIAETLWVLAGRNDVDFLTRYLPRAAQFSDDGDTWRAGYGPRIRNWHGTIDQVREIYKQLQEEIISRRAVISIYDPESDFQKSKDIPCNNWLNFICRDNVLDINIALRSNDVFWGFSGINTFEWSVLQEMMAYWLNVNIGCLHFFVGSLHYYERHFDTVSEIINNSAFKSVYDYGFKSPRFHTDFDDLDNQLRELFAIEGLMRAHKWDYLYKYEVIGDPFFRVCLQLLGVYNYYLEAGLSERMGELFGNIMTSDLRVAGIEYFMRKHKTLSWLELNNAEYEFLSQFSV